MPSLWDPNAADHLLARFDRLTPDAPARWGRFTAPDMVAHLNESIRMCLGEITPRTKNLPIRFFPLKQLIIYVFPMPRGAPTAPELLVRSGTAVWADEVKTFRELMARLSTRSSDTTWPAHPAFGPMNRRSWGVLGYKHFSHHLTQFGV
ncbi:MAG TPA: DUF1569 domain-containing protein [Gemmatimonadales bacterium]|nr:DUF1569 domain-containing protein [Gemmatimonadales bacterium]